ncbi:MAG: M48 family metalloprotease [Candidatus Eremiobacteraeota bacterium]|nr:M48 family metalloprotease [Candidatus Eremiobacteraeota bacterium]
MLRTLVAAMLLALAMAGAVHAQGARPNALDRSINAIPASALLSKPAAALMDPARQVAAQRLEGWRTPAWIAMVVLQAFALFYLWSSGTAAKIRDSLRRTIGSEFWTRAAMGALLVAAANLAALVPRFVQYRSLRAMTLSNELARGWTLHWFESTLLAMVAAGLIAAAVLWLADRTHQWYLYAIAFIVAASLCVTIANPILFAPLFNRYSDLPLSASLAHLAPLRERSHLGAIPFQELHLAPESQLGTAFVMGAGPTQRVVISDTLIAAVTAPELDFIAARNLGRVAHFDTLREAILEAVIAIVGIALAVFIADRVGFRRDDDAVSRLALVGALLAAVYVLAVPVFNAYERQLAFRADEYAVALTGDRASAVRSIVRMADQHLMPSCPTLFTRAFFGAQPATAERVAAMQGRTAACP